LLSNLPVEILLIVVWFVAYDLRHGYVVGVELLVGYQLRRPVMTRQRFLLIDSTLYIRVHFDILAHTFTIHVLNRVSVCSDDVDEVFGFSVANQGALFEHRLSQGQVL